MIVRARNTSLKQPFLHTQLCAASKVVTWLTETAQLSEDRAYASFKDQLARTKEANHIHERVH